MSVEFLGGTRTGAGGHSFAGYIENVSRDFFAGLTEDERALVLADGAKRPSSALSVLAKLPDNPGAETLAQLKTLDRQLAGIEGEPARKLAIGITAITVVGLTAAGGDPSIITAAKNDDLAGVRTQIAKRANVNEVARDGSTALLWAVYNGNVDMTRLLLELGADINEQSGNHTSPLLIALLNG